MSVTAAPHRLGLDRFVLDNLPPPEDWPIFEPGVPNNPEPMNAASILLGGDERAARRAMATSGLEWTYSELYRRVGRIARVLTEDLGVRAGGRILVRGPNHPLYAACLLAIWRVGAIAIPTMPLLRAGELKDMIERARVTLALVDYRSVDALKEAAGDTRQRFDILVYGDEYGLDALADSKLHLAPAAETDGSDPALILFSSGSTGIPKAAVHSHRDLIAVTDCFGRHVLKAREDDRFLGTSSLAFAFGLGGQLLYPLRAGASIDYVERPLPGCVAEAMERHGTTRLFAVPSALRQLQHDLPSTHRLVMTVTAGEPMSEALSRQWAERTGAPVLDGIGTTEMLNTFLSERLDLRRPGSLGQAVPGYQAAILDEDDRPITGTGDGRLAVRGPTGCRYLADPLRQRGYVIDGWNVTGDVVSRDSEGVFRYLSRVDDLIVTAGNKVAAVEVEAHLGAHPWVAECAVIGAPDEERGAAVKAFIVLVAGVMPGQAIAAELQGFVKGRVAPYKAPRQVVFVESLPRTETGKLQRFRLR